MKQVLLTFLFIFLPMLVSAEPVEIEGVWYNLVAKSNMAEVTYNPEGYTYYSGNIDIPETVTNESVIYNVTCIGDNAFENNRDLLSVKLPNSITSIGKKSFRDCYSLTTINIPKSVKTIGDEAFSGCNNISVEISDIEAWCSIVFNDLSSNPLCYGNKIYPCGDKFLKPHKSSSSSISGV